MSDLSIQLAGMNNKLTPTRFQDWKDICINKALEFNAYLIITGEEDTPEPDDPDAPTSEEKKDLKDFNARKSKMAGYLRSTLDAALLTIIADFAPNDACRIWFALLGRFESKDTNSRMFATQQLLSLRKGDLGHESENFSDYGARCVSAANLLRNLLPPGASMVQSRFTQASLTAATGDITTPAVMQRAIWTPATLTTGFSATDLVEELAIQMVIIGLGSTTEERQLKHTLTHMSVNTVEKIIEELQKADNLVRSDNLAIASNPSEALVAKASKPSSSRPVLNCKHHGKQKSHKTEDCYVLKKKAEDAAAEKAAEKKKGKQREHAKAAEDEEAELSDEEKLMLTQTARVIRAPPRI